ncbi:MAG: hypothetical protein V4568_07370 [Pseudomonadota bacterium]
MFRCIDGGFVCACVDVGKSNDAGLLEESTADCFVDIDGGFEEGSAIPLVGNGVSRTFRFLLGLLVFAPLYSKKVATKANKSTCAKHDILMLTMNGRIMVAYRSLKRVGEAQDVSPTLIYDTKLSTSRRPE